MNAGWQLRPMTPQDIDTIVEIIRAEDIAVRGRADFSREYLEQQLLADSSFDRDRDLVIVEENGQAVGLATVTRRPAFVVVHPDHEDLALRRDLLAWAERRQCELGRDPLRAGTDAGHTAQIQLLTESGYTLERFYALMVRTFALGGPPETPAIPAGYRLRLIEAESDAVALHALNDRAFGPRPDYDPQTLEDFTNSHLRFTDFEPSWSFIAETAEGYPAGLCIGWRPSDHPHGYVALLGVDPDHQRHGLARSLLLRAFGAIADADLPSAELHVASDNPRALDLYTGVGMIESERSESYARPV